MIAELIAPLALLAVAPTPIMIISPAAPAPSAVAWRCLAQIEPGQGGIYASRELDAGGKFLNEGARWREADKDRTEPRLDLSVQWHAQEGKPLTYGRGYASFYVTTPQPVARPTKFRLTGADRSRVLERFAGYSFDRTDRIVSYFPLEMLDAATGESEAFDWSFFSGKKVIQTGRLPLTRFRELAVKIPQARAMLDAAAADYRNRCQPVR